MNSVVLTIDNNYIISCSNDETIRIWNLKTASEEFKLIGHRGSITSVVVTNDNKYIISCSTDSTIRFWNIQARRQEICFVQVHEKSSLNNS